jgi:hypothetical protein
MEGSAGCGKTPIIRLSRESGIQRGLKRLDSSFGRNDALTPKRTFSAPLWVPNSVKIYCPGMECQEEI